MWHPIVWVALALGAGVAVAAESRAQTYPAGWNSHWELTDTAEELCAAGSTDRERLRVCGEYTGVEMRGSANGGGVDDATRRRMQDAGGAGDTTDATVHNEWLRARRLQ